MFYCDGMTLRDYLAAAAVPGIIASHDTNPYQGWDDVAVAAYGIADAMIAARAKTATPLPEPVSGADEAFTTKEI